MPLHVVEKLPRLGLFLPCNPIFSCLNFFCARVCRYLPPREANYTRQVWYALEALVLCGHCTTQCFRAKCQVVPPNACDAYAQMGDLTDGPMVRTCEECEVRLWPVACGRGVARAW